LKSKSIFIIYGLIILGIVFLISGTVCAKSLYTISAINANPTPIEAYNIEFNGSITFQAAYQAPFHGGGAVGIDIDSDSETLFITYEYTNLIQVLDANSIVDLGTTTVSGANSLAGIAFDNEKQLLYAVDRWTNNLYVYYWNSLTKNLAIKESRSLDGNPSSFGIALDEINDVLYIADFYTSVMYYSTDSWEKLGEFGLSHYPQSIAVDAKNQFIYTGSGWDGTTLLSKYDLKTGVEITTNVGEGVMGMAVDPTTDLLYANIGMYIGWFSTIRVFNSDLNELYSTTLNYPYPSPTGLCIPAKDVGYNPCNLCKEDGVKTNENPNPGDFINYTICFENVNDYDLHNVVLTENLPENITYISSSEGLDICDNVLYWNFSTISSEENCCMWLLVQIDSSVKPGRTIRNHVTIYSDEIPHTTRYEETKIFESFQPLYPPDQEEYSCAWEDIDCAGPINTTVTMSNSGSSSDPPIIKCKWEYDLDVMIDLDECPPCNVPEGCYTEGIWKNDSCPCLPGLQVKPILGGDVMVGYYAVVTDPQGVTTIDSVYADIWHPDGEFKYQIELEAIGFDEYGDYDKTAALEAWHHVISCHPDLVEYFDIRLYNETDIFEELDQEQAYIYYGEAPINYCQPGGWYKVGVIANDNYDSWSNYLINYFWYIPTSGIEIDFDLVDYGTVAEGYEKQAGGDYNMYTSELPTVRNTGNTPVELWVSQDDMGFGETGVPPEWNVEFAARLSSDGDKVYYDPMEPLVRIPGVINLCTIEKLDFFINVNKGWQGETYNGTIDLCSFINMSSYVFNTPEQFIGFYSGPLTQ